MADNIPWSFYGRRQELVQQERVRPTNVLPISGRVPEHRKEVAGGAGQNEQVPDEMAEPDAGIGEEEDNAGRIGEAAGKQPGDTGRRSTLHQRDGRYDDQTAHGEVEAGR